MPRPPRHYPYYLLRGRTVWLDHDLADLLMIPTEHLNRMVARNPLRFPERFSFRLTPDAKPDDGLFDVCAIREQTTLGILAKLPLAIFGWHTRLEAVRCFRTADMTIRVEGAGLSAQFDGELRQGGNEMRLRINPLALPVLVCQ